MFRATQYYIIETTMYENDITLFLDLTMIPDACFISDTSRVNWKKRSVIGHVVEIHQRCVVGMVRNPCTNLIDQWPYWDHFYMNDDETEHVCLASICGIENQIIMNYY